MRTQCSSSNFFLLNDLLSFRDVLISAKESGYVNFVVDCPQENVPIILQHAQEVGLLADEHSYIFVSPDLFTLDLERYRYGGVNMTGICFN